MTRINLVLPSELCDQHLLAEHRELTRIPNGIASGRYRKFDNIPATYRLGAGHVTFFLNKLWFLLMRYSDLHTECLLRGFAVTYKWPSDLTKAVVLWNDYVPTETALALNRARIAERMPKKPRFTRSSDEQTRT